MPGKNTGSPSAAIFPTAFYVLDEYIPFRMPRWRGSHEEIREFLESSVCDHLSAAEREHLELLIWWDDHRDLRIKEVDSPAEQKRIIAKAEEISLRAHIQNLATTRWSGCGSAIAIWTIMTRSGEPFSVRSWKKLSSTITSLMTR